MSRQLTPQSRIENFRKEAKRWLKSLRAGDSAARARFTQAFPNAPARPGLRDVQHALAREYGFPGWSAFKSEVERSALLAGTSRESAITALFDAAGRGAADRVAELLDRYPDIINERAELQGHTGKRTALHFGIRHEFVVKVLLERGANPDIRDDGDDAMPLHFAAERGDLAIVRLLIEHGADPVGEGTVHELNVLGWAVGWDYTHNAEVAEYLLAHGARHTIHTAAALGDVQAIRALAARAPEDLERPMDRTNKRRKPLHLAVIKAQPDALAVLLELGADLNSIDAAGLTPLDVAALAGEEEIVRLLIDHGAAISLPAAIALERIDDIERWLHADPDALKPGNRYGTLIIRASERGSAGTIERLIQAGAAVDVRDDTETAIDQTSGYTPLHAAAWSGNTEAIRVLLKHGADPTIRESKYGSTPAGWAAYAGQEEACRLILEGEIDLFEVIDFDLTHRIPAIIERSPWVLDRRYRDYAPWKPPGDEWHPAPWHTPLVWAIVKNKPAAVRALLEYGAAQIAAPDSRTLLQIAQEAGPEEVVSLLRQYEHFDLTHAGRVRLFVKNACPDHDIRGPWHHVMARNTAERLLRKHPEIARDSFYTALVCGNRAEVERTLASDPDAANRKGGPKGWTPLLYLCFTRLPHEAVTANAVAIARLLLDRGADPNAYFMAGGSRYTPLVGAIGEGEEDRPAHQRRDELVELLLERGAEPYDIQVIYNIRFHGRVLWFLKLMHDYSVRRGRAADWQDPEWSMLSMGGYGSGARWHLDIAINNNDLELAEWVLAHGANPNAAPARDPRLPRRTPYEEAVRRGHAKLAELLLRYGATPAEVARDTESEFVGACLRLDRGEVKRLLRAHPEYLRSTAALFAAAEQNRVDVVRFLLDLGMNPDLADDTGQRALHIAAYNDAVDVAALLVERGAEIDPVESNWENTPLAAAVHMAHERMIQLLGRYSRDLWNLVFTGQVERLREVLAEQPERARTVGNDGSTLLMWLPDDDARAREIVELLVSHGADPAARDQQGRTAADYAARRGFDLGTALSFPF